MSKDGFNSKYLHSSYPSELLQNIILSKEIYNGENSVKTEMGFKQQIKNEVVDIKYVVTQKSVYFKDKKNHETI